MIVNLRGILLRFTGYQSQIPVEAGTVQEGLDRLIERHPPLRDVLLDRNGAVRPTHLVALNGEALDVGELQTPVDEDDRVDIVTAVSGG